jgi:signal transduction histidine kinase
MRRIAMNLRPSTLDDLGILPTLGWFCREFKSVYTQFEVAVIVDVQEEEIAEPVKTAIYRIVQEAFNNIVRHSGARNISLDLASDDGYVRLRIADDGVGFEQKRSTKADKNANGLGMASMRERAESTGGRFGLESRSGTGTTLTIAWPALSRLERYSAAHDW